jgi:hypothetical protein
MEEFISVSFLYKGFGKKGAPQYFYHFWVYFKLVLSQSP